MELPVYHLNIGELVISEEPLRLCTVLGSCVSVCMRAKGTSFAGMIHFTLPTATSEQKNQPRSIEDRLRFGDDAIEILIEELCRRSHVAIDRLEAKIAGGASVLHELKQGQTIGPKNIAIAKKILTDFRIPILEAHVGGTVGRKIYYATDSGALEVRMIKGHAA